MPLKQSGRVKFLFEGEDGASLLLENFSRTDCGEYSIRAYNIAGSITHSVMVTAPGEKNLCSTLSCQVKTQDVKILRFSRLFKHFNFTSKVRWYELYKKDVTNYCATDFFKQCEYLSTFYYLSNGTCFEDETWVDRTGFSTSKIYFLVSLDLRHTLSPSCCKIWSLYRRLKSHYEACTFITLKVNPEYIMQFNFGSKRNECESNDWIFNELLYSRKTGVYSSKFHLQLFC